MVFIPSQAGRFGENLGSKDVGRVSRGDGGPGAHSYSFLFGCSLAFLVSFDIAAACRIEPDKYVNVKGLCNFENETLGTPELARMVLLPAWFLTWSVHVRHAAAKLFCYILSVHCLLIANYSP